MNRATSHNVKSQLIRSGAILCALMMLGAGLAGCGSDSTGPKPPAPVATVVVTPAAPSLVPGDTVRLTATPKDDQGAALSGRVVTWTSSAEAVATVDANGLVTAHTQGTATITATSEGQHGDASITVSATPVATVALTPDSGVVMVGDTLRLTATLLAASGDTLTGRAITWTSSDTAVATVDASGLVTARAILDSVTITATAEGHAAPAKLRVVVRFATVLAGDGHSCGLTAAGAAYCWGYNGEGALGTGTTADDSVPVAVAGGHTFTQLAVGGHTCGLTAAGTAYCWGYNADGELGDGTTTDRPSPTAVSGSLTFTQLAAGGFHTCGLTSAGAAYCWGLNDSGQLGDSSNTASSIPVAVAGGLTFSQIRASYRGTCGLTATGAAYCWGDNSFGQLGDGTTTNRSAPVPVSGGLAFTELSTSSSHTCALTAAGVAYCWGNNGFGQLGTGSKTASPTPVAVSGGLTFSDIGASQSAHTCGITTSGSAYCWGLNQLGELGDGTTTDRHAPTAVGGGLTFSQVSTGNNYTCALTVDGLAYCWGYNSGELGDDTMTDSSVPVAVYGQP